MIVEYPKQAIVLAAGLGSRMAPITQHTPKPLLPFLGVEMLELAVSHLHRAGVARVAINAKHLSHRITEFVDTRLIHVFPGIEFFVSVEAGVLGTGGALSNLRHWLSPGPFWVVNSDAVFFQPLDAMAASHVTSGNDATLMVTRSAEHRTLRFLKTTPDGILLERMPGHHEHGATFCGVHINEQSIFRFLPARGNSCVLRAGHLPWAAAGGIVRVFETEAFWADAGTPERYVEAHKRALPNAPDWLRSASSRLPRT